MILRISAILLLLFSTQQAHSQNSPVFGEDIGEYARDGECDDSRFIGRGRSTLTSDEYQLRDASDCRAAWSAGSIQLAATYLANNSSTPSFGDDSGEYAFDGECDDNRFAGIGRSILSTDSHRGKDATDCRAAWRQGRVHALSRESSTIPSYSDPSSQTELIQTIQAGLIELGYLDGFVSGVLSTETVAAIRAFQVDFEFPDTGEPSAQLALLIGGAMMLSAAESSNNSEDRPARGSGSGFLIANGGYVLTNHHVVAQCNEIYLDDDTRLEVIALEQSSDLALLRGVINTNQSSVLRLRSGRGLRVAEEILVAGFPLSGIISSELNVTLGNVTALSGPGQDRTIYQISAPVQPGNSGGPVLDDAGRLVGVVVSKLDAMAVAQETGDIPQNINFAISLGTVQSFLDAHGVEYFTNDNQSRKESEKLAEIARRSTYKIVCR